MRPELRTVVEDAYDIFGPYRIRHSLSVLHVGGGRATAPQDAVAGHPCRPARRVHQLRPRLGRRWRGSSTMKNAFSIRTSSSCPTRSFLADAQREALAVCYSSCAKYCQVTRL